MRHILLHAAWVLASVLGSGYAQARCIAYGPAPGETDPVKAEVRHALSTSAAVFLGHVTAMEYVPVHTERGNGEMLVIRMAARTWWKGTGSQEVRLNTVNYRYPDGITSSEAHEYEYRPGKTYLVYASADGEGLRANTCTRTRPVDTAANDIAVLDALKSESPTAPHTASSPPSPAAPR